MWAGFICQVNVDGEEYLSVCESHPHEGPESSDGQVVAELRVQQVLHDIEVLKCGVVERVV